MAITDYGTIEKNPDSPDYGSPIPDGSWRNAIVTGCELPFTIAFTLEMVFKILGMGFWFEGFPLLPPPL